MYLQKLVCDSENGWHKRYSVIISTTHQSMYNVSITYGGMVDIANVT